MKQTRRLKVILQIEQFKVRRKHFLKPQSADIYILVQNKMYSFHRNYLSDCEFLNKKLESQQQKICVLDQNIKSFIFLKVIGCIYGLQCCFQRTQEVMDIYQMVVYIQFKILRQMIEMDFKKNFEQYGFFVLYTISHRFGIQWLIKMCNQQLLSLGFEQLNFNRLEFLNCEKQIVRKLIDLYRQYHQHKIHNILPINKMKYIIKQYSRIKNLNSQLFINLLVDLQNIIKETDSQNCSQEQNLIIKRFKKNKKAYQLLKNNITRQKSALNRIKSLNIQNRNIIQQEMLKDHQLVYQIEKQKIQKNRSNQQCINLIPCLDKQASLDDKLAKQQTDSMQQDQPSNNSNFSVFCQFFQSRFLTQSQDNDTISLNSHLTATCKVQKNQAKKIQRRTYRSISPPSSPSTPNFGQYLTVDILKSQSSKKSRKNKKVK